MVKKSLWRSMLAWSSSGFVLLLTVPGWADGGRPSYQAESAAGEPGTPPPSVDADEGSEDAAAPDLAPVATPPEPRPTTPSATMKPLLPVTVATPAVAADGLGGKKAIEISTPPPEQGSVEFSPGNQPTEGLVRTDAFEVTGDEGAQLGEEGAENKVAIYQGIIPGTRDELPNMQRFSQAKRPYITWIGFQPMGNGRIFVKLTQPTSFNLLQVKGDLYHLDIQDARIAFRNDRRMIDASYFPGNLTSVNAQSTGRGTRIVLQLKKPAQPSIRQQGPYLFLELP